MKKYYVKDSALYESAVEISEQGYMEITEEQYQTRLAAAEADRVPGVPVTVVCED